MTFRSRSSAISLRSSTEPLISVNSRTLGSYDPMSTARNVLDEKKKETTLAALKSQAESEMIASDSLIVVSSFLLPTTRKRSVLVGRPNVDSAGLQPESIYPDSDVHG